MKPSLIGCFSGCLSLLAWSSAAMAEVGSWNSDQSDFSSITQDVREIVAAKNHYGSALTLAMESAALSRNPNQNLMFSPSSSALALEMLMNGSSQKSST